MKIFLNVWCWWFILGVILRHLLAKYSKWWSKKKFYFLKIQHFYRIAHFKAWFTMEVCFHLLLLILSIKHSTVSFLPTFLHIVYEASINPHLMSLEVGTKNYHKSVDVSNSHFIECCCLLTISLSLLCLFSFLSRVVFCSEIIHIETCNKIYRRAKSSSDLHVKIKWYVDE